MSAPLILTVGDLRALADGLDAMSRTRREHGIHPGLYEEGVTLAGYFDEHQLRVEWREVDELEQYVIADRYGS